MNKRHSATQQLNRRFLLSLLTISLTIFLVEIAVMLVLDFYRQHIASLTVYQEAAIDALLMCLISAPLLWFFVLRRLVVQIGLERDVALKQTRLNAELRRAMDYHSLVSIANAQGQIIHANKIFCEVSGYSLEELLGKDHRIINSGYHDKDYIRTMWQTIRQGQIWQGVFCNRRKNGSLYWVDSTITPLKDEYGLIYQYISVRQDITAQKQANEQLIMLMRAVNASADMILLTDAARHIHYTNPALCRISGWPEMALQGKTPDILDSPHCDKATLAAMDAALGKGESWSGRLLQRRKAPLPFAIAGQTPPPDPQDYWVELNISPVVNRDSSLAGYVQIQRDINAQVQEEIARQMEIEDTAACLAIAELLQQSAPLAERCGQVLDILFSLQAFGLQRKGGVFLRPPEEDCLHLFVLRGQFSEEFIRKEQRVALGDCLCGRAAVSGELLISDDCFCDPRHEHTFQGMQAHGHYIVPIVATGGVLGIIFLYTTPYPAHLSKRIAMLKQVGEMLGIAVLQDRAQASLEKARDMAMQAALAKSEFLANMSHEIRTPMNGVLGMLDLLRDTDMSANQWSLLETAYSSAEALLVILNDILDFSKLEAGKVELEHIDFNLPELAEDVCALLAVRAHAKNLELNCFMPTELPSFWQGDPGRIRQVLTNLIGNAVKFTEYGEVSVTAQYLPDSLGQHRVRFEVRDTGIGIAEPAQAQLFQAFSQAESNTSRRFGGTGLGLSICKKMVELMGGDIGLQSASGQGTCFWFTLPLQPGQVPVTDKPPTDIVGKRVLIVDDNATNRMILKHYLTYWGIVANTADSGSAALAELHQALTDGTPYHLALLDMHMPQMDGLSLARLITGTPALTDLPRIMLTSGGLLNDAERRDLGLAQCLLKPARQTQLFDAISHALCDDGQTLSPKAKQPPPKPSYAGKKVLVVEDNQVNQKVIIGMLAKFQVSPDLADNGKLAFDKLLQTTYDLILMDCQMPMMDGYQTTRELRLLEKGRNFPRQTIVALTANADNNERTNCLAAGMDDYLAKPFTQEQLTAMLARWLGADAEEYPDTESAQALPAPTTPVWDRAVALQNLADDEELLLAMLAVFLDQAPGQLADVQKGAATADLPLLANTAHSLKGSLSYLGAEDARACAGAIEAAVRNQPPADYGQLCTELQLKITALMAVFRHYLADNSIEGQT
ncbi:response regulator [Methylovulum psychrotolerans]|uniref:Sensory/regulatory protein RpfC n=1 Tax=Methylovulum psychrotolerans TaxID=1704499 RepID=A0A2S5CKW0_9GAMM|nr:response regulator [Methylovulum psychrotolerans]POZ51451.1 histidine kinase [Methylovulum psychrotolerans]